MSFRSIVCLQSVTELCRNEKSSSCCLSEQNISCCETGQVSLSPFKCGQSNKESYFSRRTQHCLSCVSSSIHQFSNPSSLSKSNKNLQFFLHFTKLDIRLPCSTTAWFYQMNRCRLVFNFIFLLFKRNIWEYHLIQTVLIEWCRKGSCGLWMTKNDTCRLKINLDAMYCKCTGVQNSMIQP